MLSYAQSSLFVIASMMMSVVIVAVLNRAWPISRAYTLGAAKGTDPSKVALIVINAILSSAPLQALPPNRIGHKLTVLVYDLHSHKYVEGRHVVVYPLSHDNF
jgi:hypothetical protein